MSAPLRKQFQDPMTLHTALTFRPAYSEIKNGVQKEHRGLPKRSPNLEALFAPRTISDVAPNNIGITRYWKVGSSYNVAVVYVCQVARNLRLRRETCESLNECVKEESQ